MKIKNWKKFQHFKNRRPPWIKVHRDMLNQRDINLISDRSFRVLIGLWLLASEDFEMEGNLPDIPEIAFLLRMEEGQIIDSIQELEHFILFDESDIDINVTSERHQSVPPETETETEKEKHIRSNPSDVEHVFDTFWEKYPRKENKKKARAAFARITKKKQEAAIADCGVRYQNIDKQFIPLATTYIHGERWDDEIVERKEPEKQLRIPRDRDQWQAFAKQHDLPQASSHDTYDTWYKKMAQALENRSYN